MGTRKAAERLLSTNLRAPRPGLVGEVEASTGANLRLTDSVGGSLADPVPLEHPARAVRRALYHMARKAFPTDAALAEAIGVHRSQITRWKAGDPANPENAWLLRDFAFAAETLAEHFAAETAHAWLHGRSPELGGDTPVDAIRGGRVADVLMAIQAQVSGAYS